MPQEISTPTTPDIDIALEGSTDYLDPYSLSVIKSFLAIETQLKNGQTEAALQQALTEILRQDSAMQYELVTNVDPLKDYIPKVLAKIRAMIEALLKAQKMRRGIVSKVDNQDGIGILETKINDVRGTIAALELIKDASVAETLNKRIEELQSEERKYQLRLNYERAQKILQLLVVVEAGLVGLHLKFLKQG